MKGLQPSETGAAGQSDRTLLERARLRPHQSCDSGPVGVCRACADETKHHFSVSKCCTGDTGQVSGGRRYFSNVKIRKKKNRRAGGPVGSTLAMGDNEDVVTNRLMSS